MSGKATTRSRDERLEAWVSRDQKALFQRAAELQGRTLTDFVIASVHDAAVRVIEETQTIRLDPAERRRQPGLRGGAPQSEGTERSAQGGRPAIPQAGRCVSGLCRADASH